MFTREPVGSTERYTIWCNSLTPEEMLLQQYRELTLIQVAHGAALCLLWSLIDTLLCSRRQVRCIVLVVFLSADVVHVSGHV